MLKRRYYANSDMVHISWAGYQILTSERQLKRLTLTCVTLLTDIIHNSMHKPALLAIHPTPMTSYPTVKEYP